MGFKSLQRTVEDNLHIRNIYIRLFLAEFLGTFLLLSFGIGCTGQFVLGHGAFGGYLALLWGWGWGVSMGVWASIGVSGGHLNPAISLAMVIIGRLSFIKLLVYWAAQYLGAFVASSCVFGVLYDGLNNFDGGVRQVIGENATAGIWSTYPQPYLSTAGGVGDQVFATMLLVVCVMAITDKRNSSIPSGAIPICCGILVMAIGASFGMNCGYAINPARDFGPRLFTWAAGWGSSVFTAYNYWFWVPLVAPHIGAICGAFIYLGIVGNHFPDEAKIRPDEACSKDLDSVVVSTPI